MNKTQRTARKHGLMTAGLVLIMGSIYLGDVYYDTQLTPNAAIAKCGQGNVQTVITSGFYKREVTCFPAG